VRKSMYLNYTGKVTARERALAVARAGFDAAELFCFADDREALAVQRAAAAEYGLWTEAVHADFKNINDIWKDDESAAAIFGFLIKSLESTARLDISVMVVHLSSGIFPPSFNETGLERFKILCDRGASLGVKIAFENLRKTAYLDYVMGKIPNAYFCFDCGHENLYNGGDGVLERYANRLACMHLHDNNSCIDNHFLPYDGHIDWPRMARRLAGIDFKCNLCFEVFCKPEDYASFPERVMERAKRLEETYYANKHRN